MAPDTFGIVGTTLAGSFEVEAAVAEGGFGVVYRAHHRGFRAAVALKCLTVPAGMTDGERDTFLTQFRKEAEILFRLSAAIPEVVRPLHIDVATLPDGRFMPFLALEWLRGATLSDFLDDRRAGGEEPLGLEAAMELLQPIAAALARAHRFAGPDGVESIVHRDIKPENIFLTSVGDEDGVKILDFGIAKVRKLVTERGDTHKSVGGEPSAFTPGYAAPEQWQPKRFGATGTFTDVWGLALTLVETLSGLPAIDGDMLVMRALALDEARRPTPRSLGVTVTDGVERAFERALSVDPRKRTQRVEDLWTELESALGLPASLFLLEATRESSRSSPRLRQSRSDIPDRASAPPSPSSKRAFALTQPAEPDAPAATDAAAPAAASVDALAEAPLIDLEVPAIASLSTRARPPPPPVRIPALNVAADAPRPTPTAPAASAMRLDAHEAVIDAERFALAPSSSPPRPRVFTPIDARFPRVAESQPRASITEPIAVLVLAVGVGVGERYIAHEAGRPYMLGPLRLTWIAGVLVIVGAAWLISRLLARR